MGKRVITALIALGIFLPLLYEGGIGLRTLFLLLSTVGIYEFFQMNFISNIVIFIFTKTASSIT